MTMTMAGPTMSDSDEDEDGSDDGSDEEDELPAFDGRGGNQLTGRLGQALAQAMLDRAGGGVDGVGLSYMSSSSRSARADLGLVPARGYNSSKEITCQPGLRIQVKPCRLKELEHEAWKVLCYACLISDEEWKEPINTHFKARYIYIYI